jgi:hypothetical protein
MESGWQRLGQAIIGHRPLSRFVQIDRLVTVQMGAGTAVTTPFHLPHGRFTVFVHYDPEAAVRSFALVDEHGHALPDWSMTRMPMTFVAPLVQHVLPAGTYYLEVRTATRTCSWMAQVVLNSMLSWEAPPPAWRPAWPPPERIEVRRGQTPAFRVVQTGFYDIDLSIGDWKIGAPWSGGAPHPYWLDVRAADGHSVHVGHATATGGQSPNPLFLGAAEWTVEVDTSYEWQLALKPVIGARGGGSRGF